MSPAKTIEELEAAAAKASAEAAAAREAIDARRLAAAARRDAAVEAWDRRALEAWNDEALEAEEQEARRSFVQAVESDPVLVAWVRFRAVRRRRMDLLGEMQGVLNRYGINRRLPNIGPGEEKFDTALQATLDRLAAAVAGDEQDARYAERQAAGEAAAAEAPRA